MRSECSIPIQSEMASIIFLLPLCVSAMFFILCAIASEFHQRSDSSKLLVYNITCDSHFDENCQSESLETIAAKLEEKPHDFAVHVQIDIKISWLQLNATVKFSNFSSLIISGHRNNTTILCSDEFVNNSRSDAGIVLSDIQDTIVLSNLNLTSCGSNPADVLNQTFETEYCTSLSALTVFRCNNVELRELTIERSKGVGLMILNHNGAIVRVISTIFKENKPQKNYSVMGTTYYGGGGVYIELSGGRPFPITLLFENCTFINNNSSFESQPIDYRYGFLEGNDRNGGGVYVVVKDGSQNVYISFADCNFTANQAYFGGGMSVNFQNDNGNNMIKNITLEVEDSHYELNGCRGSAKDSKYGGGLGLKFSSADLGGSGSGVHDCHFIVRNVTFIENCALIGGGVYYFSYHGKQESNYPQSSAQIDACRFKHNKGHVGSALAMIPDIFLKAHMGYIVVPTVRNCHFLNNVVFEERNRIQSVAGISTIYASLYDITFEGHNVFKNNNGTALYSVNGILNFQKSNVTFVNNTGLHGGAVALIGFSRMIVGQNRSYEFINNSAMFLGGAIFVSQTDITDFLVSKTCFIQDASYTVPDLHTEWQANIIFTGNIAQNITAGHAIYATSLNSCSMADNSTENSTLLDAFKLRGFIFDDDDVPQIATDGATLTLNKSMPLMIIPGENFKHGVLTTDDLGHMVETSFRVDLCGKESSDIQLDSDFSAIIDDEVQLVGREGQSATLHLETISARQTYVELSVTLLGCPPGFKLNKTPLKCVCNSQNHLGLLRCNEEDFNSFLITGYWIGYIKSQLVTSACPFCDYGYGLDTAKSEIALPKSCSQSELDNKICGKTRTGVACGICRHNYTVHFHSQYFLCKPTHLAGCKVGWLVYLLIELVPVILFLFIVLAFNISFTSGGINGFILFSQLLCSLDIHASGIITIPKGSLRNAMQKYQSFYGIFNLDFDFLWQSFCLWKGASALDMIAFKYITILHALVMVVIVILLINKCGGRCFGKCCRITTIKTSITHGISTFLMISYAQCIKVSLNLLRPAYIYTEYNSGHNNNVSIRPRVWFNGELEYFSGTHLLYAIPALFFLLTFGLLPPALLLCYPLLNKVLTYLGLEDSKIVKFIGGKLPTSVYKPLLDSFQGCFKDNFRFFAGLYFLYRWCFPLARFSSEFSNYYTSVGGILVFILTLHTICQPYIKRAHNIIDTLLFSNLTLINFLLFFNYHKSRSQKPNNDAISSSVAVQLMLIYLPVVVMGIYVIICLFKKAAMCLGGKSHTSDLSGKLAIPVNANKLRELVISTISRNENSDLYEEEFIHERDMCTCNYFS